jgi:hypothetical protein
VILGTSIARTAAAVILDARLVDRLSKRVIVAGETPAA